MLRMEAPESLKIEMPKESQGREIGGGQHSPQPIRESGYELPHQGPEMSFDTLLT